MDKLLRKNWLVRIISFVTALMLYAIVSSGESQVPTPTSVGTTGNSSEEMTMTAKLDLKYDSDKFVVSGAPQNVNLKITGANDLVLKARPLATKKAYIDLTGMKAGTYDVHVQTSGFPSGLSVKADPATVRVTLQEKTSKEFPVSVDILNKGTIGKNYTVGDPVIDPKTVTVTGGEDVVDSIAFVRGVINVRGENDTVDKMITLHAYDNSGTQVDADISPSSVHVRVPVAKTAKQMNIQGTTTGSPAEGYEVSSIELSQNSVTVFASDEDALDAITGIEPLSVSVEGLRQDKTFSVSVPLPQGAKKVDPEKVTLTVHIAQTGSSSDSQSSGTTSSGAERTKSRQFSDIPVTVNGLADNRKATLDHDSKVDVAVKGKAADVDALTKQDIQAQINLEGLDTGEHQVAVHITVSGGLNAVSSPEKLGVKIS